MSFHASEFRQQPSGSQHDAVFSPALQHAPPIVDKVLRSPGQLLDASTRTLAESRFGHDFSGVRVHTDAQATTSAYAVNARAYAVGRDIVFGRGQYAPHTAAGQKLLTHELTHVVQQRDAATRGSMPLQVSPPKSASENEAQAVVNSATEAGYPAVTPIVQGRPQLSRQVADEDIERRAPSGQRKNDPLPYQEAMEATERGTREEYLRDCASVSGRILERLERSPLSPYEKVQKLERRVKRLPTVFEKRETIKEQIKQHPAESQYKDQLREFDKAVIEPEFGQGYVLGTLEDELARAQCELSQARWEFIVWMRHGRIPGRLISRP